MDTIQRFLFDKEDARGEIAHLTDSFQTIIAQRDYPPYLRKLLGETLLAAALMANTIKFKGELTIQFQSDGPIKTIVAKCNHENHIRGFIDWDPLATEERMQIQLGAGQLVITIQQESQPPYQSFVPLQHHTVTEALEHYFAQSEQLSTRVWCAVSEKHAAGMMLQLIPGNQNSSTAAQRERFWEHATRLGETITATELLELDNQEILHRLYHQEDIRVFKERPIIFKCTCTLERMENSLRLIGKDEVYSLLKTSREVEVTCEYCSNMYAFDKNYIDKIFSD